MDRLNASAKAMKMLKFERTRTPAKNPTPDPNLRPTNPQFNCSHQNRCAGYRLADLLMKSPITFTPHCMR